MKSFLLFRVGLLLVISLCFQECSDKWHVTKTYVYYKPVYSTSAEIKGAVSFAAPQQIKSPGRIYYKDNFLFINEIGQGIHVIDNHDRSSPVMKGFLKVPGSHDIVIVDNVLYTDSFVDLVVFDISNINSIKEINRIGGVFDNLQYYGFPMLDGKDLVLTSWQKVEDVHVYDSESDVLIQPWGGYQYADGIALSSSMISGGGKSSGSAGIGGSTARFTVANGNLYALDGAKLEIINLLVPKSPVSTGEININADAETLFPFKDKLFVGSRSGMFIYSISDPKAPTLISKYEHMRSCDPVVVDDTYAYVTLRSGNSCAGYTNQLEVINITNASAPFMVKTYPMTNPFGLGIDKDLLFICDGADGLKIFDAKDKNTIDTHLLAQFPEITSIDVIPFQSVAMVITSDGLYQYDYSDLKNIHLLSKLPISQ
ncbi:hypothetical protein BH10BAC4_BH10BAC4_23760 [soil metagenome]